MFTKNWLAAATATASKPDPKAISPTLRSDIYAALDLTKPWLAGTTPRQAGDGVSYQPILTLIHKHFPDLALSIDAIGNTESEVALIVAGMTNMVLEMSKWDGMAGAMSMRTWVDALSDAHARVDRAGGAPSPVTIPRRKEHVGRGITRGINQLTDVSLMTREFAPRIQIISLLKSGKPHVSLTSIQTPDKNAVMIVIAPTPTPPGLSDCESGTTVNTKVHGAGTDEARQGEALWSSKFI